MGGHDDHHPASGGGWPEAEAVRVSVVDFGPADREDDPATEPPPTPGPDSIVAVPGFG